MLQLISVNYINRRTGGIMNLSGLSHKRSRFYGKTQSIMLSILITRPKKAAVISVSSQGKLVDGI